MGIKATLKADHIPVNKYTLFLVGTIPITFTKVAGIEYEVDGVDLPDRTKASGGNTQAIEFSAEMPMHHIAELTAMEIWFEEAQDPVSSTYKKAASLIMQSGSGATIKTYSILGLWVCKRKLPDLDFEDEGAMAVVEWTFYADSILPI